MVGVPGLLSSELTDIMGTEVGVETCTMSPVNGGLKEAEVAGGTWRGGGGDWGCMGRVVGGWRGSKNEVLSTVDNGLEMTMEGLRG